MLKKESDLLYYFAIRPWQGYTESELKRLYGTKSRSYVELFLKKYSREGILRNDKIGKTTVYYLNLESVKARVYAGTVLEFNAWNKKHMPIKDLVALIDKIPYPNHITLVTGSYAKGTQTQESDFDVVVIIEPSSEVKKVQAQLSLQADLNIPAIHLYVFKTVDFIEMLRNREHNYGKEIVKNCLILTQGETFLKLIDEAIKNGFNSKTLYQ